MWTASCENASMTRLARNLATTLADQSSSTFPFRSCVLSVSKRSFSTTPINPEVCRQVFHSAVRNCGAAREYGNRLYTFVLLVSTARQPASPCCCEA